MFAKLDDSNSGLLLPTVAVAICSTLHRYNYITTTQIVPIVFVILSPPPHFAHILYRSKKSDVKDKKERRKIINYFQKKKDSPCKVGRLKRKNKKRNVYDTDAILSTEFPVFHEDFSGRSG